MPRKAAARNHPASGQAFHFASKTPGGIVALPRWGLPSPSRPLASSGAQSGTTTQIGATSTPQIAKARSGPRARTPASPIRHPLAVWSVRPMSGHCHDLRLNQQYRPPRSRPSSFYPIRHRTIQCGNGHSPTHSAPVPRKDCQIRNEIRKKGQAAVFGVLTNRQDVPSAPRSRPFTHLVKTPNRLRCHRFLPPHTRAQHCPCTQLLSTGAGGLICHKIAAVVCG